MQIQLDFDIKEGEGLKQQGIQVAVDHAEAVDPGWNEQAFTMFKDWLKGWPVGYKFLTEDFRVWSSIFGLPDPPSKRAFGNVPVRAKKEGLIRSAGLAQTKVRTSTAASQRSGKNMKMPISEVYNEDCMTGMARFPDKFFDLAIVDPPYGIQINMNMGRKKNMKPVHKDKKWDSEIPTMEYFTELFRVSKNQIIWGGNYFPLPLTKAWIFWDKYVPNGVDFADGELAWTSFDKTLVKAKVPYSGFQGMDKGGKIHPTQKPIKLYKWIIETYSSPGQRIIDTHLGSGSSRIAASKLGVDFYGWELDPDYFMSQNRRFIESSNEPLFNINSSSQATLL